jgi:3alpha(or 20beta)-hydroxysteroid dehydrogenase
MEPTGHGASNEGMNCMVQQRRLEGKTALITGCAQGTGAVLARVFQAEGARLVLGDVQEEKGRAVASELGPDVRFLPLDVRSSEDWTAAARLAETEFGGVDVLVNNAAVLHLAAIDRTTRTDFLRVVEINQLGPLLGIQAVLPSMKRAGGGSIINIVSSDGLKGMNAVAAYASTKWGLRGLTKSAAIELGRYAIRVNAVCPEAGNPNMSSPFLPGQPDLSDVPHQMMQKILKDPRPADPEIRIEDVARMALFLASDESRSCTGGDFVVDAGLTTGWYQDGLPSA